MAWTPISGTVPQYQTSTGALASGYYLKFYASGTSTAISMATGSGGGSTLDKCQLDSSGYPTTDGTTRFIPHVAQTYKIILYKNATDADNNTTGNADWVIDGIAQSAAAVAESQVSIENQLGSEASGSVFTLNDFSYALGVNQLLVYRNGNLQRVGSSFDYTETSSTSITTTSTPLANDTYSFVKATSTTSISADASTTTYTPTGSGAQATNVQAELRKKHNLSNFGTAQAWIDDATAGDTIYVDTANVSWDGLIINKNVRIVGLGRELGVVTGTWDVTNAGALSEFVDIHFKTPSTTYMIDVTGSGNLDFKRCKFSAGTGNFIFRWDDDSRTIAAIELIQCHVTTGKLLDCSAGGVTTFQMHCKEACLISITENDFLTTAAGNYAQFLCYQSLINVSSGVTRVATDQRGVLLLRQNIIDDDTAAKLILNNGSGVTYDTIDATGNVLSRTDGATKRYVPVPSFFDGNGVSAKIPARAALTTGGVTVDADEHLDYYVYTGDPTLTGNVTYSVTGGLYEGQRIMVYFSGTCTTGGNVLNAFGISFSSNLTTIESFAVELIYVNAGWEVFNYGRSAFSALQAGTQTDVADTSGATLGALETSVNAVKQVLRDAKIMA